MSAPLGCRAPEGRLWRDLDFHFFWDAAWGDRGLDHYRLWSALLTPLQVVVLSTLGSFHMTPLVLGYA